MNIKQLSEVTGCSRQTVNRVAKELYPARFTNGKKTDFKEVESIEIVRLLRKQGFMAPSQNEKLPSQIEKPVETRMDALESKFEKLMEFLIAREMNGKKDEPKQIAAKLEPKDEIRKIINSYTHHTGTQYRDNWNLLYQECYYRLGKNFRVLAQNRNVKPMEIILEEGFVHDVLLVARDLFQLGRA